MLSEEEQVKQKKQRKEDAKDDLKAAIAQSKRYIIHDRVEEANKLISDTIQSILSVYDDSDIELLPAYFTMAEANVCMGGPKLKKAEQLLIAGYWNLLKHTSDENKGGQDGSSIPENEIRTYRASLHKTFGRLFTAQNRFENAIEELSKGIFLECLEHGPESIELCSSYYYLGSIFQQLGKKEETKSFYSKIIEVWKRFILEKDFKEEEGLQYTSIPDEIYYEEAKKHLQNILVFFEVEYGPQHQLTAECEVAFALVMLKTGNIMVAMEFLQKASHIYINSLSEFHPKTKEVEELNKKVEILLMETHEGEME